MALGSHPGSSSIIKVYDHGQHPYRDRPGARLHSRTGCGGPGGRPRRRACGHAVSARAERLPAHRPRQVDLPELRRRARSSAAPATCASTTRTRRRKTSSTSSDQGRRARGSGSSGTACSTRPTTSSSSTSTPSQLIKQRQGLRRQPDAPTRSARYRGTLTEPGTDSPYRDRPVEENLDLFARMRAGEFADGAHVLRAKIDMASPNINMRDPVLYRIRRAHASSHRRRVVHLSDVRLRAPAVGRARAHHALALHARIRGSSAALRLADREPVRCRPSRGRSSSRA